MIINQFKSLKDLKNFLENEDNFEKFNFPKIAFDGSKLVFSKGDALNEKKNCHNW
jgi:hypothetical protein